MSDLPVVVLKEIFGFLSVSERLRARCICRTWKFVIETFNSPQDLCIHFKGYPFNETWCFSNQVVVRDEMLQLKGHRDGHHESISKFFHRMEFFQNLQRVCLYYLGDKAIHLFLQEAHHLTRLKVLMICGGNAIRRWTLSLKSLEKFSLDYYRCVGIELNTPSLDSFALWPSFSSDQVQVKFRYPLKVKHLLCEKFTSRWSELKNLETLVCLAIAFDFRLGDFESLKRIEIWPTDQELPMVQQIREERKRSKRNELEMIVSGFREELVSCLRSESSLQLTRDYLEKIENNRSKFVGYAPWEASVDLRTLAEFAGKIPNELDHFLDIDTVSELLFRDSAPFEFEESGISPSRLIEILQRYKPRSFKLRNKACLTQEFYEQLTRLESLTELSFRIRLQSFDFDCLFNLQGIRNLNLIAPRLPPGLICKLAKRLKHLLFFKFSCAPLPHFFICIRFCIGPNLSYRLKKREGELFKKCGDMDGLFQEIERIEQHELLQEHFKQNL